MTEFLSNLPHDLSGGFGSVQAMLGWLIGFVGFVVFLGWCFFVVGIFTLINRIDRWFDRIGNRMREWQMKRYWRRRHAREARLKSAH